MGTKRQQFAARPVWPSHTRLFAAASRRIAYAVVVLVVLLCLACAGHTYKHSVYRSSDLAFRTGPPGDGWRAIEVTGARLAFRDEARDATVAVGARCNKDGDDVPLQSLTRQLFLIFTDRQIIAETTRTLDDREALRSQLTAKLDGVQKSFVVYVLKKDCCVYDFMYISDPRTFEEGVPDFDRFVTGFGVIDRGGAGRCPS